MSRSVRPRPRLLKSAEERTAADVSLRSGLDEYDDLPRFRP